MKLKETKPPRTYMVGNRGPTIEIKDCGRVELEADEQLTFTTESGGEYDLTRKDWGFYATPSLNSRLSRFKLKACLVKNPSDNFFVLLCEEGFEKSFMNYVESEDLEIVSWLDKTEELMKIRSVLMQDS